MRAQEDRPATKPNPTPWQRIGLRRPFVSDHAPPSPLALRWDRYSACTGQVKPRAGGLFHTSRSEALVIPCTSRSSFLEVGRYFQFQVLDYPCKSSDHLLEHALPRSEGWTIKGRMGEMGEC
jgi:hypothetical protein